LIEGVLAIEDVERHGILLNLIGFSREGLLAKIRQQVA
jgi:hypothetical protein